MLTVNVLRTAESNQADLRRSRLRKGFIDQYIDEASMGHFQRRFIHADLERS